MLTFDFEGTAVEISKDDVLIETLQKDGFVSDTDAGYTVVLDTNLTDELIEEGFVREIISKVQTMRKESNFEVQDHIHVIYQGSAKIDAIMEKYAGEIKGQLLAVDLVSGSPDGKKWSINGEDVTIAITKV